MKSSVKKEKDLKEVNIIFKNIFNLIFIFCHENCEFDILVEFNWCENDNKNVFQIAVKA